MRHGYVDCDYRLIVLRINGVFEVFSCQSESPDTDCHSGRRRQLLERERIDM